MEIAKIIANHPKTLLRMCLILFMLDSFGATSHGRPGGYVYRIRKASRRLRPARRLVRIAGQPAR